MVTGTRRAGARSVTRHGRLGPADYAALIRPRDRFIGDGDALHFDQQFRAGEAGDGDQGAGREVVAEDLAAQLGEAVAEPRVGDEHGHRDHVGQLGAGFFEGAAEPGEHLPHLAVEIAGEGAAAAVLGRDLAGQPDRAAARS